MLDTSPKAHAVAELGRWHVMSNEACSTTECVARLYVWADLGSLLARLCVHERAARSHMRGPINRQGALVECVVRLHSHWGRSHRTSLSAPPNYGTSGLGLGKELPTSVPGTGTGGKNPARVSHGGERGGRGFQCERGLRA